MPIRTPRLDLIPATVASLTAERRGPRALAAELGVAVPEDWPPELYDRDAIEFSLAGLAREPASADWWTHYFVRRAVGSEPSLALGAGGYIGPPRDGSVEIGYSVMPAERRRGYASEAAAGLVARAFVVPEVARVVAHTLPELVASIGVLQACGFAHTGPGAEAGTIRFELTRSAWLRSAGVPGGGSR